MGCCHAPHVPVTSHGFCGSPGVRRTQLPWRLSEFARSKISEVGFHEHRLNPPRFELLSRQCLAGSMTEPTSDHESSIRPHAKTDATGGDKIKKYRYPKALSRVAKIKRERGRRQTPRDLTNQCDSRPARSLARHTRVGNATTTRCDLQELSRTTRWGSPRKINERKERRLGRIKKIN